MDLKATHSTLNRFGEQVVGKSKLNLKRKKKTASGGLIDSINFKTKVSKNSIEFDLFMEDYWAYVDYGVKGIGGSRKKPNVWGELKYKLKRVTNSKYKYKKGIQNKPSSKHFNGWTVRKGIAPRSSGGQFTSRKGLMEAISQSVWHTGLETTSFFTKPFEKEFKELPDELIEAYAIDVDNFLEFAIK